MGFIKKVGSFLKNELRLDRRDWFFMAGISTIFVGIVSLSITKFSLWYDEAFSAYMIRFDYFDIAKFTALDVHSPLYYWLLKTWCIFFGTSELALRSLSLFFGILSIIVAYLLVKYISDRKTAIITSCVLLLSPILIRYSYETRMYTMLLFFAFISSLVLVIAKKYKNKDVLWRIYGLLIGLGLLVHYMAILVIAAHLTWIILQVDNREVKVPIFFSKGFITSVKYCLAVVCLWLPFMISQFFLIQKSGFWMSSFDINSVFDFFSSTLVFLSVKEYPVALISIFAIIALICYKTFNRVRNNNRINNSGLLLITCMVFVPPIILTLISLPPLSPLFIARYLVCSSVIFVIWFVMLIGSARYPKSIFYILISLFTMVLFFGAYSVTIHGEISKYDERSNDLSDLISEIDRVDKAMPVLANSYDTFYGVFYYSNTNRDVFFIDREEDVNLGSYTPVRNSKYRVSGLDGVSRFSKFWYIVPLHPDEPEIKNLHNPRKNWRECYSIIKNTTKYGVGYRAVLYETINL